MKSGYRTAIRSALNYDASMRRGFGFLMLYGLLCGVCVALVSCATSSNLVRIQPDVAPRPLISPAAEAIPVIQLTGTPSELGTQHGQQLHDEIVALHDQYLMKFIAGGSKRLAAMAAATLFENQLPPEYRKEIQALAASTGLPERDVMLGQCFLDLLPVTACSLVTLPAEASSDGVPRFGRNLDFFSLGIADKHSVLLIYHPANRFAFAAISWPGMIGVLSGMNEYGLSVASAEVPRDMRWPTAMPYTLLYRTVLEQCRTVDEAISLLRRTPRQSANNLMLMDAAGDRAVAEISPEAVVIRRAPSTQPLTCTNDHRGADGMIHPISGGSERRYNVLQDQSATLFGNLSVAAIEHLLNDVAQGDFTMQSMVFEPTHKSMYLAVGTHATTRPYVRYDLGGLMSLR